MKSVSVVIVSYHTGRVLFESISSVLKQKEICQIIVVDNGNPDSVLHDLNSEFGADRRFQLITGHGNIGFSRACNLGAKRATGELLLLLNPDCISPKNGIMLLSKLSESYSGKWLITPRIVNVDGTEQQGARREILTPWIAFVEGVKLYKILPNHPYFKRFDHRDQPLPDKIIEVPVTSGACLLIKTSLYRELGGIDDGYFLHVEDIDFCMRFRKAGGKIYFCPHVTFVHVLGTSKASRLFIEWHKLNGFRRYFRLHFSDIYFPGFIGIVNCLMSVRFGLIAIKELSIKFIRMLRRQKAEVKSLNEVSLTSDHLEKNQAEKNVVYSSTPVENASSHMSNSDSSV